MEAATARTPTIQTLMSPIFRPILDQLGWLMVKGYRKISSLKNIVQKEKNWQSELAERKNVGKTEEKER